MRVEQPMRYGSILGSVCYDESDDMWFGEVLGIYPMLIKYEAKSREELEEKFHKAIEEYVKGTPK